MNALATIAVEYIDLLLRDAAVRVGLGIIESKPATWCRLLDPSDNDYADNLKRYTYVTRYLLNPKRLMQSFLAFFQCKASIPFDSKVIVSVVCGKETNVVDHFKYKIQRFKRNLSDLTRIKYKAVISHYENEVGGKGNKLRQARTHQDQLDRRRYKRSSNTKTRGKIFYLYKYGKNINHKTVMVQHTMCNVISISLRNLFIFHILLLL